MWVGLDDQLIVDMHHDGAAPECSHGIAEDVTGCGLYDVLHELGAVGIQPFPLLRGADAFIGDAFAAELVRSHLGLHIGHLPPGWQGDEQHPAPAGKGQTIVGGGVLVADCLHDSSVHSPPEFHDVRIGLPPCIHCCNCIEFTNGKGCLAAKSLSVTGGENGMDLKGMNRYQHFGLRRPWLEHFFEHKENCFTMGSLGTRQYDSLRVWLKEAGLLTATGKGAKSGVPTPLFNKVQPLGAGNPLTWAVIWTNLAYNSIISKWYMLNAPAGEIYEKNDLIFLLGDDYSKSTRDNAVTALLETFRHSPIGTVLKQGIPIPNGNSYKFSKQGWNTPDAVAILYALYMWAEATGRYTFTLGQMAAARGNAEAKGVDPVSIFGINPDRFKDILQDISLQFDKYIRTTFVADLDNVQLFPEYKSLDILDLIAK